MNDSKEVIKIRVKKASEILCISEEKIKTNLENLGIYYDDISLQILDSDSTKESDARQIFIEKNPADKIAIPRFNAAWKILKGKDPFKEVEEKLPKNIGQYSDEQLLKQYGKDCFPKIEEELRSRCKDRPIIIFKNTKTEKIDVESSLKLLRIARRQNTPTTFKVETEVTGEIKRVYRVGEFPLEYFFECPFHDNVLLVEGYCEECANTWDTSEEDKMILVRMIEQENDISDLDKKSLAINSFDKLKNLFPKIAMKYEELKEKDELKSLKRHVSSTSNGSDPFHIAHRTY